MAKKSNGRKKKAQYTGGRASESKGVWSVHVRAHDRRPPTRRS